MCNCLMSVLEWEIEVMPSPLEPDFLFLACCEHKLRHFSWYVPTPWADEATHQINFIDYDSQAVCGKESSAKTNKFSITQQRKHEV